METDIACIDQGLRKTAMFFPYYVLRYEKNLPGALPKDRERLECLLQEFEDLREREHGVLPCSLLYIEY